MRSQKSACRDAIKALHVLCCALTLYILLLDLSMMRAVIRHAVHVQMLWKEWEPHPGKRLVIFVLGSNVLLILWHLLSHLPTPLDYQNGYLHGGILIDFIGQKPGSKSRLLLLDLIYLFAQVALADIRTHQNQSQTVEAEEEGLLEAHEARIVYRIGSGMKNAWQIENPDVSETTGPPAADS